MHRICPLLVSLRLRAESAGDDDRALSLLCAALGFGEVTR